MGRKGLDANFLRYGIRQEDLAIIESVCQEFDVDYHWLKEEMIKPYHEKKTNNEEMDAKTLSGILKAALNKIK